MRCSGGQCPRPHHKMSVYEAKPVSDSKAIRTERSRKRPNSTSASDYDNSHKHFAGGTVAARSPRRNCGPSSCWNASATARFTCVRQHGVAEGDLAYLSAPLITLYITMQRYPKESSIELMITHEPQNSLLQVTV